MFNFMAVFVPPLIFFIMSDWSNFDWSSVVSSLLGVGSNLISSGTTNKRMRAAQRRQFNYQKQLMEIAQDYNVQNFNMENEYNSPLQQRLRMREAGLNPNFVDGVSPVVGQLDGLSAGSAPAGDVSPLDLTNNAVAAARVYSDIRNQKKQLDLQEKQIDSSIEVNDSVIAKNQADAMKSNVEADNIKNVQNPLGLSQIALYNKQVEDLVSQINNRNLNTEISLKRVAMDADRLQSDIAVNSENITNMQELRRFAEERLPHEIKKLDAETQKLYVDALCAQILAKNDSMRVRIDQQNANTNRYNAETSRINAMTERDRLAYDKQMGDLRYEMEYWAQQFRNKQVNVETMTNELQYKAYKFCFDDNLKLDLATKRAIYSKMIEEIYKLRNENEWFTYDKILEGVDRVINGVNALKPSSVPIPGK